MRYRIPLLVLITLLLYTSSSLGEVPKRIISGMPSITEMLFALDLGDRVVGVTTNCNYPPAALKKPKIGGFFLNLEKVVSLKPDLVIMLEDAQKRDIEKFRNFGLPVYTINPRNVDGVMDCLSKLGEKTGTKAKAEELVEDMKDRIAAVQPKESGIDFVLKRARVLAIVGYEPLIVAGGGTFIDDVLKRAGVENLAAGSRAAYPQFSFEKLLKDDPEYIIIPEGTVKAEEISKSSRWKGLDAVKHHRVLFINADIISRPGPRVVDAIEEIARFTNENKN